MPSGNAIARCMAIAAGLVVALGGVAAAQDIGYTASVFVARGAYPTSEVTSVYIFNSVDASRGPFRASFSVPFVRQQATGTTIDPLTGATVPLDQSTTGFGDPIFRVDWRLIDDRTQGLQLGIAGSVKPPIVGTDSGLGTGVADVAAGATLFKIAGATSLFADLMFWKYGDPVGVDFQDSVFYSVGFGRVISNGRWSTMLSLSGFSSGIEGEVPPVQLSLAVLTMPTRRQSLAISAGFGLAGGAGDLSIGTSWRIQR